MYFADFRENETSFELAEVCLSLCAFKKGYFIPSGTATIVAPFIAVTAKHVIEDYISQFEYTYNKLTAHVCVSFEIFLLQKINKGAETYVWKGTKTAFNQATDIAYIWLEPTKKEQLNYEWKCAELEMLPPSLESEIHALGYRNSRVKFKDRIMHQIETFSFSAGVVKEIHQQKRDEAFMNFPCIRTNARFDHGMSGGPIMNKDGRLVAVISSGMPPTEEIDEHCSYGALLWPSMLIGADMTSFYQREEFKISQIRELFDGHGQGTALNFDNIEFLNYREGKYQRAALHI